MSTMTDLFLADLGKAGFFEEWARFVRTKAPAAALAAFALEGMRDAEDGRKRQAFTAFAAFMRTRTWAEALSELRGAFRKEDMEALEDAFAEQFYLRLREMILGQIEEYYNQVLTEENGRMKEVNAMFCDPKVAANIALLIRQEVVVQMEAFQKRFEENVKRLMEEGDDWKAGGDSSQPHE